MARNASPVESAYRQAGRTPTEDVPGLRMALDVALDAWWQEGRLPAPPLLRDGLFLLQAGHTLQPAHTSLLLRAALAHHRGMLTALRHQSDSERTAVILADALLAPPPASLSLAELRRLRQGDEESAAWMAALPGVLYEETSSADAGRRARALAVIDALGAGLPHEPLPVERGAGGPGTGEPGAYELIEAEEWQLAEEDAPPQRGAAWVKAALALVLLAALAVGALWLQQRQQLQGMIAVPAGTYQVSAAATGGSQTVTQTVTLPAFAIDQYEVTVRDYRACIERGRCPQPSSARSETRSNYLLDPAFDRFPVVNVDWAAAHSYCAAQGKRLPAAVEWEVAAGYAPETGSQSTYPWGEQFQLQRANSVRTGLGDTQEIGSYRPIGDSARGVADMAGNVAEWTATNVGREAGEDVDRFLVKGGSYRDQPAALAVAAGMPQAASSSAPWLGLRCAVDLGGDLPGARSTPIP